MYSKGQLFLSLNLLFYILFANVCGSSPTHAPSKYVAGYGGGNNGGYNGGGYGGGNNGGGNNGICRLDVLQLAVCADILGLINIVIGSPPTRPCCSLLDGLVDLEAAICLCTAIRANIIGIYVNIPITLSLLLNVCGRKVPPGFVCYM